MTSIDKKLVTVFIFLLFVVLGQVGIYIFLTQQKREVTCKNSSISSYLPLLYALKSNDDALKNGELLSYTSTFEYKYEVISIKENCSTKINKITLRPDICIQFVSPRTKTKTSTLIYKFVSTPAISVLQRGSDNTTKQIKLEDIKKGDTILIKSTHDQSKGSKENYLDYDNVTELVLTKLP